MVSAARGASPASAVAKAQPPASREHEPASGPPGRPGSSGQMTVARPRPGATTSGGRPAVGAASRSGPKRALPSQSQPNALKVKGLPLALKFSVPISLLFIVAMTIFGYVSIHTTESRLTGEIVNSGYGQLLALQGFAQKVMKEFQGVHDKGDLNNKLFDYAANRSAPDKQFITDILKREPRVFDIMILAAPDPSPSPSLPVLKGLDGHSFTPEKTPVRVEMAGADPDIQVLWGSYQTGKDTAQHYERCLFFRMPIREPQGDTHTDRMYASLNLILSAREIQDEVGSMKFKLFLLGLLLTASAVGVALMLAHYTVGPIKALVYDMNTVAKGNLEHQSPVADTSTDEVGLLATAFNHMTASLRVGRESERENQRISGELNTAKSIHIKLMPEKLPQLPGIDIFTAYQSAKEVGGDYYDFIPVGDAEHLALCVADVSGKGIPGSMVMGTTRTILRMMAVGNLSPADVLRKTNFHVARDIKRGMFVTCVYCILNVRTREMSIASAGHNPMLIYREATGQVEKIRPNGIALGFDKGPVFDRTIREERIQLEKGDRVVLYTDGVVEAMDPDRVEWSEEALDAFTLKNATLTSKEYVRLLIKELDDHQGAGEQHDDITVTTFRVMS